MPPATLVLILAAGAVIFFSDAGRSLTRAFIPSLPDAPGGGVSDVGAIAGAVGAVAQLGSGLVELGSEAAFGRQTRKDERRDQLRDVNRETVLRQIARRSKSTYHALARADVREWVIQDDGRIFVWYFTQAVGANRFTDDQIAQADDVIAQFSASPTSNVVAQQQVITEKRLIQNNNPAGVIAWAAGLGIHPRLVKQNGKSKYGVAFGRNDPPDFVIEPPGPGDLEAYKTALAAEPVVRATGRFIQRGGRLVSPYIEFPPDEPAFHPKNPFAPPELRLDTLREERLARQAEADAQAAGDPNG